MRVGLIKAVPVKWDLEHNWHVVEGLMRRTADRGVDMFCTPGCGTMTTSGGCAPARTKTRRRDRTLFCPYTRRCAENPQGA